MKSKSISAIKKLRSILKSMDGNISMTARAIGVSKVYLWDVVRGNRKAGKKLLDAIEKY